MQIATDFEPDSIYRIYEFLAGTKMPRAIASQAGICSITSYHHHDVPAQNKQE